MYKVQSNLKINGLHWGLSFRDGVAYTDDIDLARKLKGKGYLVTKEKDSNVKKTGSAPNRRKKKKLLLLATAKRRTTKKRKVDEPCLMI